MNQDGYYYSFLHVNNLLALSILITSSGVNNDKEMPVLSTVKIQNPPTQDPLGRRVLERTTRAAKRRLTAMGIAMIIAGTILVLIILSALAPVRAFLDWMGDTGRQIEQSVFPDEEFLTSVQRTFATNFTESEPIGQGSADINVNDLEITREGDFLGLGESSQTIDMAVAEVRWTVYAQDVQIKSENGQVTVHLPEAVFAGVWQPVEGLAFAEYEANFMARLGDVFNGVDSIDAIEAEFVRQLNEQADIHAPRLKAMAEAAAERSVLGLFAAQETTVVVVFDE